MPTSAEIAAQLAAYDANKKSSADIVNTAMSQYGVPEIRQRVSGLRTTLSNTENALNNVDPSVTGRTSRSLVTEAQRSRIVNKEREPIAAQYGSISRNLANENADLGDQTRAAQMLAEGQINDYTTGRNALQSRYQDAVTSENEQQRRAEADRAYAAQKLNDDRDYQLNVTKAASSGSGSTPKGYKYSSSKTGGFSFQGPSGPVTAAQYASATGQSIADLLSASNDAGDKKILGEIQKGVPFAQLAAKYPWVFGGV